MSRYVNTRAAYVCLKLKDPLREMYFKCIVNNTRNNSQREKKKPQQQTRPKRFVLLSLDYAVLNEIPRSHLVT